MGIWIWHYSPVLYNPLMSLLSTQTIQILRPDCIIHRIWLVSKIKKHYSARSAREYFLQKLESLISSTFIHVKKNKNKQKSVQHVVGYCLAWLGVAQIYNFLLCLEPAGITGAWFSEGPFLKGVRWKRQYRKANVFSWPHISEK